MWEFEVGRQQKTKKDFLRFIMGKFSGESPKNRRYKK